jgi:hypothetical protein
MICKRHRQTIAPLGRGTFRLPGSDHIAHARNMVESPYFQTTDPRKEAPGRDTNILPNHMKVFIQNIDTFDFSAYTAQVTFVVEDGLNPGSTYQYSMSLAGILDTESFVSAVNDTVITNTAGITAADIFWNSGVPGPRSFANPARALNSAFQISTTRDAIVSYTVDIAATLSLTTGQSGIVTLKYADDSAMTTNVVTVQSSVNGNAGTLAIGLDLTQTATATLGGIIPAGKYVKLVTGNTTGTPTFTMRAAQEVLL